MRGQVDVPGVAVGPPRCHCLWLFLSLTDWGRNYLHVTRNKGAMGLVFLINVSEDGDVTSVLVGTGPGSDLTPEDFEIFKSKLRSLRMPLKNIIKVTETDTCPRD
nr:odorant-binding protein [Oryctolagus cuniculus]